VARFVFTPTSIGAPVEGTIEFGTLTLAGQGGYPVTGTSITSGDSSNHWTITSGKIVPTAAAVSAGYSGAPYELTFNDDSTLTIVCPADVRHVDTLAQTQAALDAKVSLDGKTVRVRGGVKGGRLDYWGVAGTPPVFVLEAADPANPPEFTYFETRGASPNGNFTLRNLRFYAADVFPPKAPVYIRAASSSFFPVLVEGCEIEGATVPSIENVGWLGYGYGLDIDSSATTPGAITVRNCNIHHVGWGIFTRGTGNIIQNNDIHHIWADGISVRGGSLGLTIRGNRMYEFIGDNDFRHSDGIQFTDSKSGNIHDLTVEGNVIFMGDFLATQQQGARSDRTNATERPSFQVTLTSPTTLTAASHASRLIRIDKAAPADTFTVTLPPAADCPQESIWFQPTDSSGTSDLPYIVAGVSGGDVTVAASDPWRGLYAVRSTGTTWEPYNPGFFPGTHGVTSNHTVLARQWGNVLRCDATSGNITITLPDAASSEDGRFINILRVDSSGNTVTVQRSGSDTFSGTFTGTSFQVPARKGVSITGGGTPNWIVQDGRYDLQGIFGNPLSDGNTYNNIIVRGNIIWCEASHAMRLELYSGPFKCYNNTFAQPYHPDRDGNGVVNGFDGRYPVQTPVVRMNGNVSISNSERFGASNFITCAAMWNENGGTPTYEQDNIVLNLSGTDPSATVSSLNTYVQGSTIGDFYPTTVDEAIDALLAKAGGPLDGTFIGALGTTRSNGYWDFTTGQKNPSAPEPTIP